MANETECLTDGTIYHTMIKSRSISIDIDLPTPLNLSEKEAAILDILIHNQLELILRYYIDRKNHGE